MLTLRWILGAVIVFLAGGFIILCMVASGFRKSFGASELNPLLVVLPVLAMAVLFAGLLFPHAKTLLHLGALAALGLVAFCIRQIVADFAPTLLFGLAYLVAWLTFYWLAVFKSAAV